MQTGNFRKTLSAGLLVIVSMTMAVGQKVFRADNPAIPTNALLRILRYEDERRWDDGLHVLLASKDAKVRKRAALALGRIGDERAVPALIDVMKADVDQDVRQMAAFAIGEIESPAGADALIAVIEDTRQPAEVRARAVEALGKIGAVLLSNSGASGGQGAQPRTEDKPLAKIRLTILEALKFEADKRATADRFTILLGLTAALRARPEGAGPVVATFLDHTDPRIVADALNTMARLRLKDRNDRVRQLLGNGEAIVRANAARVIGAAEDKQAFDALLSRALNDYDLRVRVSAIRALGSLKDVRAGMPLVKRASDLDSIMGKMTAKNIPYPAELNETLEIATTLGRIFQATNNVNVLPPIYGMHADSKSRPEVETAYARISPLGYLGSIAPYSSDKRIELQSQLRSWREESGIAQGLSTIVSLPEYVREKPTWSPWIEQLLRGLLEVRELPNAKSPQRTEYAVPDVLRAFVLLKTSDMADILRAHLKKDDVIIRATAADLLSEQPPDESNARALVEALPVALRDRELNDAALSILDALAKQKSAAANDAIRTALNSSDHLIRRRAVSLLKANGVGDFSDRIGLVRTRNTDADYRRAIARIGRKVTVTVVTSKGSFDIEFLPAEAPLTVDNFVQLARKGYFNGQTVPRVVPNFVIQTGDPRGDQNGGPGYQIRCEINEAPYERGAVGMALSGKDTGGSQWFVTHSPQPHLDGGYTVFGRVIRGMDVVDNIARGDTIRRVVVNEK